MRRQQTILSKRWQLILTAAILFCVSSQLYANFAHEYTLHAIRTLNFARFTEWSSNTLENSNKMINLCVLGDPSIHNAFNQIEKRPVGSKTIKIIHLTIEKNFNQCKVLYLNGMDDIKTQALLFKLRTLPILTISEEKNFIENNGMVQLKMDSGQIKMIVNLNAVTRAGLKINSRVLKIAKVVYY